MKLFNFLISAFIVTVMISGCTDTLMDEVTQTNLSTNKKPESVVHKKSTIDLCGAQEVPAVSTSGEGQFEYWLNPNGTLHYKLKAKSLSSNVLFAHIHIGGCGVNGPVAATLFGNFLPNGVPVNGTFVNSSLSDADLVGPLAGQTIADLLNVFANGGAYINVHTFDNPSGELRGQIGDATCKCEKEVVMKKNSIDLCGSQEVPAVSTSAKGQFDYWLSPNGSLHYKLKAKGLSSNVLFAHIHVAGCGVNGPVGATLFGNFAPNGVPVNGTFVNSTLSDSDLVGPLAGQTISDLMSLFASGGAYINVHSVNVPSGELRGQVVDDGCSCD